LDLRIWEQNGYWQHKRELPFQLEQRPSKPLEQISSL
jgi:hypothetical protein